MGKWMLIGVCAALFLAAAALLLRAHRLHDRLDRLIADAIRGDFHPTQYDESRISRTEQKMAQFLSASSLSRAALDQDRARIQSLISDISHQTRTPIASILLYTSLLCEEPLTPEAHDLASQASAQAEKLRFLVQSLVMASHLETGVVQVHPVRAPLRGLLDSLLASFHSAAQDKNIALTASETDSTAYFDPKWTAEAIGNLIDNAIKYTPAGGAVRLSVQEFSMFCAVTVADTGPGIPEAEQAKIFARFYRSPQVAALPGVGIGLYLTREILQAQGGYVKVCSVPGQGAKFSAYLPKEPYLRKLP